MISSGRGGARYSSSSSLSSAATSSSPNSNVGVTLNSTQLLQSSHLPSSSASPAIATAIHHNAPSNSPRQHNTSSPNTISLPLSLTTIGGKTITPTNGGPQMIDISSIQALNKKSTLSSSNQTMAINLTTCDGGISPALIVAAPSGGSVNGMTPINFSSSPNITHQSGGISYTTQNSIGPHAGLQIISTNSSIKDLSGKNGFRLSEISRQEPTPSLMLSKDLSKIESTSKNDPEPPTKVIKLINGNTIALAPVMDKDNKIIGPGSTLTLQQVVGGGGLVVSQIPFLTSSGGLRVIGQAPNGLATIELSSPVTQSSGGRGMIQSTHPPVSGAQLHKLLSSSNIVTTSANSNETARLPGGAELNILPATSNGFYRNQKLAIVNNGITLKGRICFLYFIFKFV